MPRTERDIVIGKIVAPIGTRGEVKAIVLTDFPERFEAEAELDLKFADGSYRTVKIEALRQHKDGLVLKLNGVETRDDAEAIRNAEFVIDENDLAELPSGSYYVFDLIGVKVATDDGRDLGVVTEILQGGANDVYVTSMGLCIPALKDIVANVDLDEGLMTIRPVPGLLPED